MPLRSAIWQKRFLSRPRRLLRSWLRPLRGVFRPADYGHLQKRVARLEATVSSLISSRHAPIASADDPRAALRRQELRVFSQNGEDGILLWLFSQVGVTDRRFVEFGIGEVTQCNSTNLAVHFGWSGLLLDGRSELVERARKFFARRSGGERVRCAEAWVTPKNVDATLHEFGFEGDLDLLSLDIDGNDYWVWEAIRAIRPRIAVVEYNASLGPDESLCTPYEEPFDRYARHPLGWHFGASLAAIEKLGRAKGYVLVGCESAGFNAFFVREDVDRGDLPELSAREAWYPDARRLRVASQEEQAASLRELPWVRV